LVQISARDLGDFIEFTVADNGPGIAQHNHQRIFQLFQTLRARDEVEASGMGLPMVKKTIEHYNGTITLDSAHGAGCTFRFTWPKVYEATHYT
jgi:signal transduction histidine kinase